MSLVFFEEIMAEQMALLPAVQVNANVTRKPSFGWGNADDLRKFLAQKQEQHNPLVWSVPQETTDSGIQGLFRRPVELNICCVETETTLLNEVRLNADKSFKKVLRPIWEQIERRFQLSDITMTTDTPTVLLIPNYNLGEDYEAQYVWDVLKVRFEVNYSEEYKPCNS